MTPAAPCRYYVKPPQFLRLRLGDFEIPPEAARGAWDPQAEIEVAAEELFDGLRIGLPASRLADLAGPRLKSNLPAAGYVPLRVSSLALRYELQTFREEMGVPEPAASAPAEANEAAVESAPAEARELAAGVPPPPPEPPQARPAPKIPLARQKPRGIFFRRQPPHPEEVPPPEAPAQAPAPRPVVRIPPPRREFTRAEAEPVGFTDEAAGPPVAPEPIPQPEPIPTTESPLPEPEQAHYQAEEPRPSDFSAGATEEFPPQAAAAATPQQPVSEPPPPAAFPEWPPAPPAPPPQHVVELEPVGEVERPLLCQERLQELFLTEEPIGLEKAVALCGSLPGIHACILARGSRVLAAHNAPPHLDLISLSAHATALVEAVRSSALKMGLGEIPAVTIHSERGPVSFFHARGLSLLVLHADRGFVPGVRERLRDALRALADSPLALAEEGAGE